MSKAFTFPISEFVRRCQEQAKAVHLTLPEGLLTFVVGLEVNLAHLPNVTMQLSVDEKSSMAKAVFCGFSDRKATLSAVLRQFSKGLDSIESSWHMVYEKLPGGEPCITFNWRCTPLTKKEETVADEKKKKEDAPEIPAGLPPFLYGRCELKEKEIPVFPCVPVVSRQEVERYLSNQGWIKMDDANNKDEPPELVNFGPIDNDEPPALVECSDDDDIPGLQDVGKPCSGSVAVTREVPQAVKEPGPSTMADLEAVERAQRILRLMFKHNPDYARMKMLGQVLGVRTDDVVQCVSEAVTNAKRCTELAPKLKIVESMLNMLSHH